MKRFTLAFWLLCVFTGFSYGQNYISGPVVQTPVYFDVSPPLRDLLNNAPLKTESSWKEGVVKNKFNIRPKPVGQVLAALTDPSFQMTDGITVRNPGQLP